MEFVDFAKNRIAAMQFKTNIEISLYSGSGIEMMFVRHLRAKVDTIKKKKNYIIVISVIINRCYGSVLIVE